MHSGGQRSSMGRQTMFSLAHCSRARLRTVAQCTAKPSWVQNACGVLEAAAPILTTLGIGAVVVSPPYIVIGKVERMDAEFKQMVKQRDRVEQKLDEHSKQLSDLGKQHIEVRKQLNNMGMQLSQMETELKKQLNELLMQRRR